VLTRRIAHRVATGSADAGHVLAITFTRRAAGELLRRFGQLGLRQQPTVGTFHGVAWSVLRRRWADQGLRRRDLLGRGADLLVGQDQGGIAGERAQHVRGGLVVQVVEAAPERLAVERDHARPRGRRPVGQRPGMLAEGGLQLGRLERQEETAQRVHGRRSTEARAEHRVEALPVHADERQDAAVGGGARQHGEDREQQQVGQRVAPADVRTKWRVTSRSCRT